MIQKVLTDAVGPLLNPSENGRESYDSMDIPSISSYVAERESTTYNERYLHKISHIRLDEEDVVVYSNKVDLAPSSSGITGVCTVNKELFRIPKDEVKELIKQLMSEDE